MWQVFKGLGSTNANRPAKYFLMSSASPNVTNESCGWASRLPVFQATSVDEIVSALDAFVRGAPPEQFRAWKQSLPPLQEQCRRIIQHTSGAGEYGGSGRGHARNPDTTRDPVAVSRQQAEIRQRQIHFPGVSNDCRRGAETARQCAIHRYALVQIPGMTPWSMPQLEAASPAAAMMLVRVCPRVCLFHVRDDGRGRDLNRD
jgi:hypothetical protein